jgi:hypothetical protein
MRSRYFQSSGRLAVAAIIGLAIGVSIYALRHQSAPDWLAAVSPAAGEDVVFTSHKAIYRFSLLSVTSGAGVSDIRGQMYYEQDDACDAWTSDHRFTSEYHYPERAPVLSTSQYAAWEAKDGSLFHFTSERKENNEVVEQLRGMVERSADTSAKAQYARPPELGFDLPAGYVLPMHHTAEIIRKARAGEKFYFATLFDGTDAEGPVEVSAVIGKKLTADEIDAIAKRSPKISGVLLTPEAWHVRMAIFPLKTRRAEEGATPSYEMDLILHDNGVVGRAIVDYGQFKVAQQLEALEALPVAVCP